ncbi:MULTISPECIES: phage tail length tape measure family protein [unclassified Mesorhizobium]|uniref:phage tail length tape measure family protein n=1 Tax=unclassified Mesorhizobium TaxID=325217 RepID=UPI0016780087|nr:MULTISPECIES: phage tail length tape measure family protein [unclassified Mesorhizobium]
MTVSLSSLRVAPEADGNKFVPEMARMRDAASQMGKAVSGAGLAVAETNTKISQTGDPIARLSRQYIDGYGATVRLENGIRTLNRSLEAGRITAEQASTIYSGMVTKLGMVAGGTDIARQGYGRMSGIIDEVNARLRSQSLAADQAANSMKHLDAVNDNLSAGAVRFRRQNLMFQAQDIGVSLAGGMNPLMVLAQQGSQISGTYAGAGGVNALLKDAGGLAAGLATKLWPVALAAAAGGAAIRDMQLDLEKATGKSITFGETFSGVAQVIGDDLRSGLKPLIDGVSPWFDSAWDKVSAGTLLAGDTIINSFHAAYEDIKYLWQQFPNMMGSLVTQGLNTMIGGIQTMLQAGAGYIDAFIDKVNAALAKADALMPGSGYRLGKVGTIDFGPPLPDVYGDKLQDATAERNRRVGEIMRSSPLEDYYRSVRDRVSDNVGGVDLPSGGSGSPIPVPQFRGVDDIPGDQEFLQDFAKSSASRIRQLEQERTALGLSGAALAAYRFQQEAVNAALAKNIELNPDQLTAIKKQADAYGATVAANQNYSDAKDLATGFLGDFKSELINSGGDVGKALGTSILNALTASMDKQWEVIFDKLGAAFASWISGSRAGGASTFGAAALASAGSVAFGANDNSVMRTPLPGGGYGGDLASNIRSLAGNIGAEPRDLAALMSFESGFRPQVMGGAGGKYRGLIQMGPWEQAHYGLNDNTSLGDQFGMIEQFFKDRGFKPGMSGLDLYSTVNAGSPGRYGASDAANGGTWGTVADKWNFQMGSHFEKADQLLGVDKFNAALGKATNSLGGFDSTVTNSIKAITSSIGGTGSPFGSAGMWSALASPGFNPAPGGFAEMLGLGGAPTASSGGGGGFLSMLFGFLPKLFGFANGTENAPAGWAWVGERGPELRKLRSGDVIRSNATSMQMVNENGRSSSSRQSGPQKLEFNVNIDGANGDAHVRMLAKQAFNESIAEYHQAQVSGGFGEMQRRYASQKG